MGITSSSCVIGIDGGGTACRAAIANCDGSIIATASGGPANFATDPAATIVNVLSALGRAADAAGLTVAQLKGCAVHVGLAGVLQDADAARVAAALPFARIRVSDDRLTSLTGALGDKDGILAAVGTGTLVAARKGSLHRYFGGWGLQLSDQASGAWLGRGALMTSLMAYDGLAANSDLTQTILARFSNIPAQMVAFARNAQPSDYAGFAPAVVQAAEAGDVNARDLMQRGGEYLNKCFSAMSDADIPTICLSGGLGPHYAPYIEARFSALLCAPAGTALDGALLLARNEDQKMKA